LIEDLTFFEGDFWHREILNTLPFISYCWFLSLEESRIHSWEDVAREFMSQYKYNEELKFTHRDLELLKHNPGESVSNFITRWRDKAATITNRTSKEEHVSIVKKNFISHVRATMGGQYYPHF